MDWQAIIKTVAPWIGTALSGPLGSLAVTAAGAALGLDARSEDGIKQALAGVTPDQMLALKKADQDFAMQMQALGFKNTADLEAIAAGDRKDARGMQTATNSKVPAILSTVITVGYLGVLGGMMTGLLKTTDSQALMQMIGSLTTGWGMCLAFWFGTTHSSGEKTRLLAQADSIK